MCCLIAATECRDDRLPAAGDPLPSPRRARRGARCAQLGQRGDDAAGRRGDPGRTDRDAEPGRAPAACRPRDRRSARRRRERRASTRSQATGQSARDAASPRPCCGVAGAKAAYLGVTPFEALLDRYEPGGSVATIDRLFGELSGFLPALIEAVIERQATMPPPAEPSGRFPVAAQRAAALRLMAALGFDFDHGRLDVSAHPFSSGAPDDVRITTRYDERDFSKALMGVLHETGHALYKRNLPARWRLQPVGAARGMAIHESQSLLVEMQVCRSLAFMQFAAPVLREVFGGDGPGWEAEALYRRATRVRRGLIRVDADEVTYPAHVILRYRLERAMLAGDLAVRDLPAAWAESMRDLLGIVPDNDRDGCLQDIHWFDGSWGYFPTYTLGAMIAAQLFETARAALGGLEAAIASGRFGPLLAWLRDKVHSQGSLMSTAELVENATGRPLGTQSFERHLRARYLDGRNEPV